MTSEPDLFDDLPPPSGPKIPEPQDGHVLLAAALAAREVRNEAPWGIDPEDGPSYAEPQEAEAQAWAECKAERIDDSWTVGETANYRGFFKLGYDAALRVRLASKPSRPPCQVCGSTSESVGCECCMPIADDAPSGRPSREEAQKLIEHCASLAVSYMQDQPSWDGTVADCGYLRNAIVNGDHADFLTAHPSREEEMREAAKYSTWNIDVVDRNLTSLQGHALKTGDEYAQRWLSNARSYLAGARAALAQGGARDEGEGKR